MADHAGEDVAGGAGGAGGAGAWSVPPQVLVNEDPDPVRELLGGSRLSVVLFETSAHVHRKATAAVRRQLLARWTPPATGSANSLLR
ncbi:hypothetical protein [Streptomyces sp. NPDC058291]|uniref:hypothetical protein n=1 Tax=Streptomyces sp. NPDC058291 TaxID=3346427 RepID=UPI0036E7DF6B